MFYSRNTVIYGKLTQPAIGKMLKKHATCAHEICDEVPKNLHAHLQTTMVYLDITNDEKADALATLDDETCKKVTSKWKNADGSLFNLCGLS